MTIDALSLAALADEAKTWRRTIHQHPELLFDLPKTAALVTEKLKEFGCDEVVGGIARTGVVAVINGNRGQAARSHCARTWMPCPCRNRQTCHTHPKSKT